jgi:hypothetical protein
MADFTLNATESSKEVRKRSESGFTESMNCVFRASILDTLGVSASASVGMVEVFPRVEFVEAVLDRVDRRESLPAWTL